MCFHVDLVYHLLAHMDLKNNASCLFSNKYVQDITRKKVSLGIDSYLEQELAPFIETYLKGFERLSLINFMTFYANDLEQTRNALLTQPFYTMEDKEKFLIPFFNIAKKEKDTFYIEFWTKEIEKHSKLMKQFNIYIENKINNFNNIFKFYNVSPNIYLSLSLTQNGRGFYIKDYFNAIAPLPRSNDEFSNSFVQIFHEMTHQFTDNLIDGKISLSDDTHSLSESLVILTDFYLFKKYNSSMLEGYCKQFGITECSETVANEKYAIPLELRKRMENILLQL